MDERDRIGRKRDRACGKTRRRIRNGKRNEFVKQYLHVGNVDDHRNGNILYRGEQLFLLRLRDLFLLADKRNELYDHKRHDELYRLGKLRKVNKGGEDDRLPRVKTKRKNV